MLSDDTEIDLLETIAQGPNDVRQRDLARSIGLSLGMANAILKRLVQKGLLKIQKVNNRNIRYIVSPQGMERIAHRSYRYFRQTVKNVVYYKEAIEGLLREIQAQGFREVSLVGASDLDFIVEHLCGKYHLSLMRQDRPAPERNRRCFRLFSEKYPNPPPEGQGSALLQHLVLGSRAGSRSSAPS
jgi:DNA-binding MarR family transcriptional regulator